MNKKTVLKLAKNIVGDSATLAIHNGEGKAWALQISGCFPDEANLVANKLMASDLPYSGFRQGAGFAYLWMQ